MKKTDVVTMPVTVITLLLACFQPRACFADLTAVITGDNDFATEAEPNGKRVSVPAPVSRKIDALVDEVYADMKQHFKPGDEYYLPRSFFYGPIFRITTPKRLELYVFRRIAPLGSEFFFFILFDPTTKRVTKTPPYIFAKWMECCVVERGVGLRKPLLFFEDLDGDGRQEIVIQEQVHNGTMYNAVVYHYYHISADLAFHPVLAVETRLIDLFTEDQGGVITRTLRKMRNRQLRMDVFLEVHRSPSNSRQLGHVFLKSPKPGIPFAVTSRKVFDEKYGGMLVTAWGNEAAFLRDGYRFYY